MNGVDVQRHLEAVIDGRTLRGTAYLPDGADPTHPLPTAILHHGFGANRMEYFGGFVRLGRALARRGIVAVAFDRAGHGESDGDFIDVTPSREIADAVELVGIVRGYDIVDAADTHLVGMSLGSVVASVVAAEVEGAASLTMWSPAAVFVDEITSGTLQGMPIAPQLDAVGYFDFGGLRVGRAFFDDVASFDVYGRAAGYTGPVRVLHGADDFVAPPSYGQRYAEVYDDVEITIVEGADHGWGTYALRDLVVTETVDFIAAHRTSRP